MRKQVPMQFDPPLQACPLCEGSSIGYYDHDFAGRNVFRCRDCATKFMNPQYSDRYLAEYYSTYTMVEPDQKRLERRTISKQDDLQFVARHSEPGRFLSVGCGDGLELKLAAEAGWTPEGYDVDPDTMRRVGERRGAKTHSGDFLKLGLPADHYDCVFLDQVLEHPKNPQDYLREVHRILRPGGVLFIGCPNIFSVSSLGQTLLGRLGLKRRRGRHYGMFHHLFLYTPWQLRRILEQRYGFEVLAAEGDPLCGEGKRPLAGSFLDPPTTWLGRTFPFLESTFRLLARKKVAAPEVKPRELTRAA